jgi:HSP20 family molecular chaperone IbpA
MSALLPRVFGDFGDLFEDGYPFLVGQRIRVEDQVTDTAYIVRAELPGLDPETDVRVTTAHGVLSIHAERKEETKGVNRSEFRYGALHRSVRLPINADEEHVTATYAKGILEVTVPLTAPQPAGRKIAITVQ